MLRAHYSGSDNSSQNRPSDRIRGVTKAHKVGTCVWQNRGVSDVSLDRKIRRDRDPCLASRDSAFRHAETNDRDPSIKNGPKTLPFSSIGLCLDYRDKLVEMVRYNKFIVAVCTGAGATEDLVRGKRATINARSCRTPRRLVARYVEYQHIMQSPL